MTDLTLNEYEGLSEKELERILTEEAREICGSDSFENNSGKRFKFFKSVKGAFNRNDGTK